MNTAGCILGIKYWKLLLSGFQVCVTILLLSISSKGQSVDLRQADSLFFGGKYVESAVLYEKYLAQFDYSISIPLVVYYKLAFISEEQNNHARSLYYLSVIYNHQPRQNILNKITEIASLHHLNGYEVDDFSFIFLFFRKYSIYFILFLLVVGMYSFGVLAQKKSEKKPIRNRHKWIIAAYFVALLLFLNLPDLYKIAIINKEIAHLREKPSSAAPVKWSVAKGNKVTVIGESDQWLRIWWQQQSFYIRKLDVWEVL